MTNELLAELARVHAERHPPRTPDAARRALSTFGTPQTRADATALHRTFQAEAGLT
jgi:hypothetical protein